VNTNQSSLLESCPLNSKAEEETRRQIFEKVRRSMISLGLETPDHPTRFMAAIPDVVVAATKHAFFFEPKNCAVTQWLHKRCALSVDSADTCEKIPVHPSQRDRLVSELRAAGFEVICTKICSGLDSQCPTQVVEFI
jgi:hypothetical protein